MKVVIFDNYHRVTRRVRRGVETPVYLGYYAVDIVDPATNILYKITLRNTLKYDVVINMCRKLCSNLNYTVYECDEAFAETIKRIRKRWIATKWENAVVEKRLTSDCKIIVREFTMDDILGGRDPNRILKTIKHLLETI
jgi:hypothetical protein